MKKIYYLFAILVTPLHSFSQSQIVTTGNNTINTSNPYAADVVIGSDANGGARHDSNIMFWSSGSASRIWNSGDVFNFSQWMTTNPNVGLNATFGGASFFQGSLGIGTLTPRTKLDFGNPSSFPNDIIGFYDGGLNTRYGIGMNLNGGNDGLGGITVYSGDRGIIFRNHNINGTELMSVTNAGDFYVAGNIGIGTTTPTAKLTLAGSGNPNPNSGAQRDYNSLNITFRNETNNVGNFDVGSIKMVQPYNYYVDRADMTFSTSGGERLRINADGNVSIGTSDGQGYKFAVNGNVIATSVTVKLYSTWPDYVFKPNYTLRPLSEVQTYIYENHHLPDMPSEKEVADKGIDLGEMNKLLTKKVEELTLYMIQKDKENTELKQMLKDIGARLQQVETRLQKDK